MPFLSEAQLKALNNINQTDNHSHFWGGVLLGLLVGGMVMWFGLWWLLLGLMLFALTSGMGYHQGLGRLLEVYGLVYDRPSKSIVSKPDTELTPPSPPTTRNHNLN